VYKAILFDFDGVLTTDKTGSQSVLSALAALTSLPLDLLKREYYPFNRRLLSGQTTHRAIWPEFERACGASIDYELLLQAFRRTPLDQDMLALVGELHKTRLTGMVTDNKCDRIDGILDHHHLRGLFDVVSVSAQYGSGKDTPAIFEGTLAALNVSPSECIFIDNSAKNLIVPERIGMHTILFDDENRNINNFRETLFRLL